MKTTQLKQIIALENEIASLRQQINVSSPGEMLFQAPRNMWSDLDVVVEADGLGGARLLMVEGNYPADYSIHKETNFATEDEACEMADSLVS